MREVDVRHLALSECRAGVNMGNSTVGINQRSKDSSSRLVLKLDRWWIRLTSWFILGHLKGIVLYCYVFVCIGRWHYMKKIN